jgi:hypothetical protein
VDFGPADTSTKEPDPAEAEARKKAQRKAARARQKERKREKRQEGILQMERGMTDLHDAAADDLRRQSEVRAGGEDEDVIRAASIREKTTAERNKRMGELDSKYSDRLGEVMGLSDHEAMVREWGGMIRDAIRDEFVMRDGEDSLGVKPLYNDRSRGYVEALHELASENFSDEELASIRRQVSEGSGEAR